MKTSEKTKTELAAERDKSMAEAHKEYVETVEKARKKYVETKRKLMPELVATVPAEAGRRIMDLEKEVQELKKKLASKETPTVEASKIASDVLRGSKFKEGSR